MNGNGENGDARMSVKLDHDTYMNLIRLKTNYEYRFGRNISLTELIGHLVEKDQQTIFRITAKK